MEKPWDGRFSEKVSKLMEDFTESVSFDKRLALYDIALSTAHVLMLKKQKVLKENEAEEILKALKQIREEIESGKFVWKKELEDVHMNIEKRLTELIGDLGKKIHIGRSRNDQVVTDVRLFTRENLKEILSLLKEVKKEIIKKAKEYIDLPFPGYTHLQLAQPVLFSHYLLAYYFMFDRDESRIKDTLKRVNISPLGSAALAGTTVNIDREFTKEALGFDNITLNSMDAVSDRDFLIETIFDLALIMMHISRLSEDLIIYSSYEFNLIDLPDSLCTGSSIMPQKKNPDALELARGKCSRLYADLVGILTLLKGLPLTYNRDLQEDKIFLFDAIDTTKITLKIIKEVIKNLKVNKKRAYELSKANYALATDIAEFLSKEGIPFRDAHNIVGKFVRFAIDAKKNLDELSYKDLRGFLGKYKDTLEKKYSLEYLEKIYKDLVNPLKAINRRNVVGGTALNQVKKVIEILEKNNLEG